MEKDYFINYLLKMGLIEFYGKGKEDWKISNLGNAYCAFIFFSVMNDCFKKSDYYKKLKKEGKF